MTTVRPFPCLHPFECCTLFSLLLSPHFPFSAAGPLPFPLLFLPHYQRLIVKNICIPGDGAIIAVLSSQPVFVVFFFFKNLRLL